MSLVTLDIDQVAEVIDTAITTSAVFMDKRHKGIVNDILTVKEQLQKLIDSIEIYKGTDEKIQFLENNLKTISAKLDGYAQGCDEEDVNEKLTNYLSIEQSKPILGEIDKVKVYLEELVLNKLQNIDCRIEDVTKQIIDKIPLPRDGADGKDGIGIDGKDGIDGIDGKDGLPGNPGINGKDGIDGTSVSLNEVKSYIEKTTKQLISAMPIPKDGIGVAGAMIDRNGDLFITCTNGNTISLGTVVGKDGVDGVPGFNGKDGIDGLNGKNGENGVDGKNGENGKDGLPGSNGIDGKDGLPGSDGISGIDGKDGINGKDGKDGLNGKDGKDGENGLSGSNGKDGRDGSPGVNGDPGKDGKDAVIDEIQIKSIVSSFFNENSVPSLGEIPEEVAEKVSKAISIVAESPAIQTQQQQQQPVVVNITQPQNTQPPHNNTNPIKRIVAHRNPDGTITADVTPVYKTLTTKRDKDGVVSLNTGIEP